MLIGVSSCQRGHFTVILQKNKRPALDTGRLDCGAVETACLGQLLDDFHTLG